ncbi:hypothetical protein BH18PSE1_BH18PSE1_08810 [soil metagenome]
MSFFVGLKVTDDPRVLVRLPDLLAAINALDEIILSHCWPWRMFVQYLWASPQGRELGAFAIDLTAMTDFDHLYDARSVIYSVHHTVVALANAIPALETCKLLTSRGARFLRERRNSSNDASATPLGASGVNLLRGRRLDE